MTKYLTLIENINNNSKEDKRDAELLAQALDKLKLILSRVNDAVAFYQNSNEFKKLYENIDPKSSTYIQLKAEKKIEQIKFTVSFFICFYLCLNLGLKEWIEIEILKEKRSREQIRSKSARVEPSGCQVHVEKQQDLQRCPLSHNEWHDCILLSRQNQIRIHERKRKCFINKLRCKLLDN